MSKEYDNTNKGVLFLNDRKEKDSHPDRKGSINIDGKEYWLSAWDKETSKGATISISVQPKEGSAKPASRSAPQRQAPQSAPDFDDDENLPF